ncbi:hypothetical protein GGF32_006335, partial [Allomyces javanicus]
AADQPRPLPPRDWLHYVPRRTAHDPGGHLPRKTRRLSRTLVLGAGLVRRALDRFAARDRVAEPVTVLERAILQALRADLSRHPPALLAGHDADQVRFHKSTARHETHGGAPGRRHFIATVAPGRRPRAVDDRDHGRAHAATGCITLVSWLGRRDAIPAIGGALDPLRPCQP